MPARSRFSESVLRYLRVTRPQRIGEPVAHHPGAPPQPAPEPT